MKILPERLSELSSAEPSIADKLKPCMKKPLPVKATQMNVEFRVKTMEGDYKLGKPGDYLMCGVDGELYIIDQAIFNETYDWLD